MIIDGKKVSEEVLYSVSEKIRKEKLNITLAIILVGDDDASAIYVKNKLKSCEKVGMKGELYKLNKSDGFNSLILLIDNLNKREDIHGIILQSPLPKGWNFNKTISYINPNKDVDGLTKENVYKNYLNEDCILPCTVSGILKLFDYYDIDLMHKKVCIIGRSNLVGKPLFLALENKGATVVLCHRDTIDISEYSKEADVVIVAAGESKLLTSDMVKFGAIVIDVGINKINGNLVGDADFDNLVNRCSHITPVPGGVGPMTVACVIENTLLCYERMKKNG